MARRSRRRLSNRLANALSVNGRPCSRAPPRVFRRRRPRTVRLRRDGARRPRIEPLSSALLDEVVGKTTETKDLFRYLTELLAAEGVDLQTATVYIEPHYVDRHYLDDYAAYYAFSFIPPEPACKRIHFFKVKPEKLKESLLKACKGAEARDTAGTSLTKDYLGFVCTPTARDRRSRANGA